MTYFMHNQGSRTQTGQRGTSLVEVLVVLVILVLGIFSIARLFPGGFFTIRSAENNTFADRLAQAQLETLKQNSAFLLNAVYAYNDQLPGFDPNVNPADLNNDYPSPASPEAMYNDINKARYISGENFTVPASASAPNGVPVHVLNYGPVHIPASTLQGSLATPTDEGFDLVSAPWTAQVGSSQLSPSDLSQQVDSPNDVLVPGTATYLVDYTNGQIAVPPASYPQNFTLVVTTAGSNAVTYIVSLKVPAQNSSVVGNTSSVYNGGWFAPGDTTLGYASGNSAPAVGTAFVTGSVILTRPLKFITQDTSSTYPNLLGQADPYTCELAVGSSAEVGAPDEYMGVLAFNPRLVARQVSASYNVVDWHIIHEDVDVPAITTTFGTDTSVTNAPIRLTLNHLRRVGDVLSSQASPADAETSSVYPGLFASAPTPFDIILLDTDTGQMQGLAATSVGPQGAISDFDNDSTAPAAGQFVVSYQNGRITLPAQTSAGVSATQAWVSVPHKHLRVFYAGDYGWAVALQKNPSLYQVLPSQPTALGAGQCYQDPNNREHLIFPESDAGQSVGVDRINYTDTNGNAQQVATASGAIHTDFAGTNYVDLSPFLNNVDTTKGISFGSVRGISARAVVIWKERDQWKSRTLGTVLNRS